MEIGQAYKPSDVQFRSVLVPEWLAQYGGLSWEAKAVFARLVFHSFSGRQGIAFPSQRTLCEECALAPRTLRRRLVELQEDGLIEPIGFHKRAVIWQFLAHPAMPECSRPKAPTSERGSRPKAPPLSSGEEGQPENESKAADLAGDSRRIWPEIVGQKRRFIKDEGNSLRVGREVDGKGGHPPIPSPSVGTPATPANARAPDDDPLFLLFAELWEGTAPDAALMGLRRLVGLHGAEAVMTYLRSAAETATCRRERVLTYVERCLENRGREVRQGGTGRKSQFGL
jgi:hypothetical protein